ncbi:MAG: hypothetical protein DRK00_10535 [Thermoprotei archaeon]|nr:MAG: hypothetical protein DRK00_10535 [Thermoprotei archaeon]
MRRAVLVCIDGCGPEYLSAAGAFRWVDFSAEGWSMIPSVTNVNNVSILTGAYPREHGVTGNCYYDRAARSWVYMETPDFIRVETLVERIAELGLRTAVLASKDKLRALLGRGAGLSLSAERPPRWLRERLGEPPHIYSIEVDSWLMRAAVEVARSYAPDFMYISTTDYAMHMHPPGHAESRRHIRLIEDGLKGLLEVYEERGDEVLLCVTADHGMGDVERAVDLEVALRLRGVSVSVNVLIADRYVLHHRNMGGAAYVYLDDPSELYRALEALREVEGVEVALTAWQAARVYNLDPERIGDVVVLAARGYAFGLVGEEVVEVKLRSHGSIHEGRVPIMVHGADLDRRPRENRELAGLILEWLRQRDERCSGLPG